MVRGIAAAWLALAVACGSSSSEAEPDAVACPAPHRVFLNRDGGSYTRGLADPASNTTSLLMTPTAELAPSLYDDLQWSDLVVCVVELVEPYGIAIAVDESEPVDHEIVVTSTPPDELGYPSDQRAARNIHCTPAPAISFAFEGADPVATCYAVVANIGAAAGASPSVDCRDVMSAAAGTCGVPVFLDEEVMCGDATLPDRCVCTQQPSQRSAALMAAAYGAACVTARP